MILIAASAVGSVVLYESLRDFFSLSFPTLAPTGIGAFLPMWSPWPVLQVAWKGLIAVVAILLGLELRDQGEYFDALADAYVALGERGAQQLGSGEVPWWKRLLRFFNR